MPEAKPMMVNKSSTTRRAITPAVSAMITYLLARNACTVCGADCADPRGQVGGIYL